MTALRTLLKRRATRPEADAEAQADAARALAIVNATRDADHQLMELHAADVATVLADPDFAPLVASVRKCSGRVSGSVRWCRPENERKRREMSTDSRRHREALAALDRMNREAADRAREQAKPPAPPRRPPPPINLLDNDPATAHAQREGQALLDAMRDSGVGHGDEWHDTNELAGESK